MRRGPKPAKSKVEAKRPVARKSPKDDDPRVRDLEKRLAEALRDKAAALKLQAEAQEQQTATGEILRTIAQARTDVQPVFDAVAANAARLCGVDDVTIHQIEDGGLRRVAHVGSVPVLADSRMPLLPGGVNERVLSERRTIHISDTHAPSFVCQFPGSQHAALGTRSLLATPLVREGVAIGLIQLRRAESRPFTDRQIALLETFADQAVIAIENVRLFTELQEKNQALTEAHAQVTESLEQQTATSEILSVISSSPTDVQPVFDTIIRSAATLCGATFGNVQRFDGEFMHLVAHYSHSPEWLASMQQLYPRRPDRTQLASRAVLSRGVVHVPDVLEDREYQHDLALTGGFRGLVSVPMLRNGEPIGVITVAFPEPMPFANAQIELLKTFAAQAVIAIENVRLFTELESRNKALTEALDQQTATSEILRVISISPTETQPVFDTIVRSVHRLLGAHSAALLRLVEDRLHLMASSSTTTSGDEALRSFYPIHLNDVPLLDDALRRRQPLLIDDTETDPRITQRTREIARARGYRSVVQMPLLHSGTPIGLISVSRREPGGVAEDETKLLKTFADQAVIAIENVRLFTELESRNRDLTTALDQRTATAEILRVISSSPTNVQPTFEAIAESATRLCGAVNGLVFRFDGELIHVAAHHNIGGAELDAILSVFPIRPGRGSVAGRAIESRRIVHVEDLAQDPEYEQTRVVQAGFRTALSVPMLRGGVPIGTINVMRMAMAPFSNSQIALLQTFADQAVIAIENVRLFTELQEKNRALTDAHAQVSEALEQQTATAEVLRVISGSPTDLQPVFDSMLQSAVRLLSGFGGAILLYDGSALHLGAVTGGRPQSGAEDWFRSIYPLPLDPETPIGIAILERRMIQLPDTEESPSQITREVARGFQFRALVTVPMLREGSAIGTISITRAAPGEFSERQVDVLQTFADQAVIAIENVRLFKELDASNREIADKSRQLEVASQHKSEFLANMSHELRTPLNAIIGFSEVLTERMFGELNEKQEEYLKDIHVSGQHLLSLINDILDLSKIEAGRMELELSDFHLPTALDSALTLVRERAGRRSIALHLSVDERLGQIQADERKVRQVVLNLLSNAIKFTPEGGRIEVAAVPKDGLVEVSVTDTGVGIAPEDQEAVFEEFRQVGTADKKVEGTGLGLTLCRKFVELHDGKIWVKSELGKGSTFTFTIPVRHDD